MTPWTPPDIHGWSTMPVERPPAPSLSPSAPSASAPVQNLSFLPFFLPSFLPSFLPFFLSLLLPLLLRVLLLLDILVDSIVQLCTYKVMPNVFNESNVSNRTYEMRIVVEVAITCFPRNTVPASWIKKPRRSRTRRGQRWVVAEEAIGGNDGADGQTVT